MRRKAKSGDGIFRIFLKRMTGRRTKLMESEEEEEQGDEQGGGEGFERERRVV